MLNGYLFRAINIDAWQHLGLMENRVNFSSELN
jgi:hypothetical protein